MFRRLARKLGFLSASRHQIPKHRSGAPEERQPLSARLDENLKTLRELFGGSIDLTIREFIVGSRPDLRAALVFLSGLVDKGTIDNQILRPLMVESVLAEKEGRLSPAQAPEQMAAGLITACATKQIDTVGAAAHSIVSGETLLLINGSGKALVVDTRGWRSRNVEEPEAEVVVHGPREGFTEDLHINLAQLRRKLRNPDLTIEVVTLGRQTRTDVAIIYLRKVANPKVVEEVRQRLQQLDIDAALASGYIEEYIEDNSFSPFATVANTERPDVVVAKLLEGRVAIAVNGTPFVLTVPMLMVESFQSPDDYYSRPYYATVVRWVRYAGFAMSVLGPPAYVALTTFHQELIPTPLLISMAVAREGTPFPVVLEALIMGLMFEVLREAGIRLPRPVGQAVSIVGALVIGESAVRAGLIAAPMVIVTAATAIASFTVPAQADAAALLRLSFTVLAGAMGAFGIGIGLMGTLIHLASLRSFGTPYLSPLAPLSTEDLKDVLVRAPWWTMLTRPRAIGWHNPWRQQALQRPAPPDRAEKTDEGSGD
ncbi:MAG: spore germination protein [Bacillota bacterium]